MGQTDHPSRGGFSDDLILDLPNAAGTMVAALEFVTTLTDTTAASEDAQLVINLITAGTAATQALKLTGNQLFAPSGTGIAVCGLAFGDGTRGIYDDSGNTRFRLAIGGRAYYINRDNLLIDNAGNASSIGWNGATTDSISYIPSMTGGAGLLISGGGRTISINTVGISMNAIAAPVAPLALGATLTNNVTVGGTNGTFADFSDLTTYSNSAAAIRNDIYQLARAQKLIWDFLRARGDAS